MKPQEKALGVPKRYWNWRIWAAFLLAVAALPSYNALFAKFPVTRNVPSMSRLIFAAAAWLFWAGVRRAFGSPHVYRGKIMGPTLALLSLGAASFLDMQL